MRIIGGLYKGRKLKSPAGSGTRPTSDKVREALFDILGPAIEETSFVDLFAGTGAVGLEALSRGARLAAFVERGARALGALRRNLDLLEVPDERFRIYPVPAEKALKTMEEEGMVVDMLFCDPPYGDPGLPLLLTSLGEHLRWSQSGLLVVEYRAAGGAPVPPPGFREGRSYRYGDTALALFHRKDEVRP